MMPRIGKFLTIIMITGIVWGLAFICACDEAANKAPKAPKPKVVSKQIAQTGPPAPSKPPAPPAGPEKAGAAATQAVSSAVQAGGNDSNKTKENPKTPDPKPRAAHPVTEAQVKREQAEARTQAETRTQAEARTQAQIQAETETGLLFRSEDKYDFKGRVDPFTPLLSEKKQAAPAAVKTENIPKRILTPLEKMELSQIKLVAVLQSSKGAVAMVEEASGKGYEVRMGTYMGRNGGRVSAINSDGLLVKERYTDYQGKQRERVQEIKFHKNEGGE